MIPTSDVVSVTIARRCVPQKVLVSCWSCAETSAEQRPTDSASREFSILLSNEQDDSLLGINSGAKMSQVSPSRPFARPRVSVTIDDTLPPAMPSPGRMIDTLTPKTRRVSRLPHAEVTSLARQYNKMCFSPGARQTPWRSFADIACLLQRITGAAWIG